MREMASYSCGPAGDGSTISTYPPSEISSKTTNYYSSSGHYDDWSSDEYEQQELSRAAVARLNIERGGYSRYDPEYDVVVAAGHIAAELAPYDRHESRRRRRRSHRTTSKRQYGDSSTSSSYSSATRSSISSFSAAAGAADVLVMVGDETFVYSSHVLSYASSVIAENLIPIYQNGGTNGIRFKLDLSHKAPDEWKLVEPFLQPHSVSVASVTPDNLPLLLPWFDQLNLTALLTVCDDLLCKVEWPSPLSMSQSSKDRKSRKQQGPLSSSLTPGTVRGRDMMDLLLLTLSSGKVHLPRTRTKCLELFLLYSASHPAVMAEDMEILETLREVLQQREDALECLWERVSAFLPSDLRSDMKQNKEKDDNLSPAALIKNPLFCFLLREGINKAGSPLPREPLSPRGRRRGRSSESKPRSTSRGRSRGCRATTRQLIRLDLEEVKNCIAGEVPKASKNAARNAAREYHEHHPEDEDDEHQDALHPCVVPNHEDHQPCAAPDIPYWLTSLTSASGISQSASSDGSFAIGGERERRDHVLEFPGSGSRKLNRTSSKDLEQKMHDRSEWLESIWLNLQMPPLFPPEEDSDEVFSRHAAAAVAEKPPSRGKGKSSSKKRQAQRTSTSHTVHDGRPQDHANRNAIALGVNQDDSASTAAAAARGGGAEAEAIAALPKTDCHTSDKLSDEDSVHDNKNNVNVPSVVRTEYEYQEGKISKIVGSVVRTEYDYEDSKINKIVGVVGNGDGVRELGHDDSTELAGSLSFKVATAMQRSTYAPSSSNHLVVGTTTEYRNKQQPQQQEAHENGLQRRTFAC